MDATLITRHGHRLVIKEGRVSSQHPELTKLAQNYLDNTLHNLRSEEYNPDKYRRAIQDLADMGDMTVEYLLSPPPNKRGRIY